MYDELMRVFTLGNWPLLVVAAFTSLLGYLEYVYSFALMWREHRSPFPIWMHTFYFAHDGSWTIIMLIAAASRGWYWFFVAVAISLLSFSAFEAYNVYKAITVERKEIWGDYYQGEVTVKQAVINVGMQLAAFLCVVNILIGFMGPGSILQWFLFTNMLMAAAPGVLWTKRGARENTRIGTSMGLAIVVLVGTVNTFLPTSMWVLAMPHTFNAPWYYITGVVFIAIAGFNLYNLARLPRKPRISGHRGPIW